MLGGRTFEDEFFLSNMETGLSGDFFKKVICDSLNAFFDRYGFCLSEWEAHQSDIDGRSIKVIKKYLDAYNNRKDKCTEMAQDYEKIVFAELFLHYVKDRKGDIALQILTDDKMLDNKQKTKISVPKYIREGLEWLLK